MKYSWHYNYFYSVGAPSFYARVSLSDSQSNGSEIRFHNVLNNNKDMYNPETNTFTAQESGLYAFTASVEVTDGHAYFRAKRGEVKDELNFFPWYRRRASLPSSVLNSYPSGGFPGTASTLQLLALWRGDNVYWHSSFNVTLAPFTTTASGWFIGPCM